MNIVVTEEVAQKTYSRRSVAEDDCWNTSVHIVLKQH